MTLRTEGEPAVVSPGLDLAAYRIAQEGLTNAVRHARAGRIEVLLRWEPASLTVEVTDDGRGTGAAAADGEAGHGLVGLRERAALYGGDVSLVTAPTGGVTLRAVLPLAAVRTGGAR